MLYFPFQSTADDQQKAPHGTNETPAALHPHFTHNAEHFDAFGGDNCSPPPPQHHFAAWPPNGHSSFLPSPHYADKIAPSPNSTSSAATLE